MAKLNRPPIFWHKYNLKQTACIIATVLSHIVYSCLAHVPLLLIKALHEQTSPAAQLANSAHGAAVTSACVRWCLPTSQPTVLKDCFTTHRSLGQFYQAQKFGKAAVELLSGVARKTVQVKQGRCYSYSSTPTYCMGSQLNIHAQPSTCKVSCAACAIHALLLTSFLQTGCSVFLAFMVIC